MDKLCFVQFMHPGKEHEPDHNWGISLNQDLHRRKFMCCPGKYLDGAIRREWEILFWGEWEAESRVIPNFNVRDSDNYPRFLFAPYYKKPDNLSGLQNTDPFVFGGFFYTFCRQPDRPTLRQLSPGSVILFGSCIGPHKNGRFYLDSVFVVKSFIDHNKDNWEDVLLKHKGIPNTYRDVTFEPYYKNAKNKYANSPYRLYFGASYDNQYEGMYSFILCMPRTQAPNGFPRPNIIQEPGIKQPLNINFNHSVYQGNCI